MRIEVKRVTTMRSCPASIRVQLTKGDSIADFNRLNGLIKQHDVELVEDVIVNQFGDIVYKFTRTPHACIDAIVEAGYTLIE